MEALDQTCPGRRCVLTAAAAAGAAVVLGGCASYGGQSAAPASTVAPAEPASSAAAGAASSAAGAASGAASGGAQAAVKGLAALADIPVGSGKIFPDQAIVITQPTAGVVKAFSTVCTHQGCAVDEIAGGTINCPCHGSKFKLDGSVANGPAARPLPPVGVKVVDGQIVKA
jgi:Rieske Fe-S protein